MSSRCNIRSWATTRVCASATKVDIHLPNYSAGFFASCLCVCVYACARAQFDRLHMAFTISGLCRTNCYLKIRRVNFRVLMMYLNSTDWSQCWPWSACSCMSRYLKGTDTFSRKVTVKIDLISFWNGVYSKRNEFAPPKEQFHSFRVDTFSEWAWWAREQSENNKLFSIVNITENLSSRT